MAISLKDYLPSGRNPSILTVGMFVNSLGTGMFLAGGTLFFLRVVGLSAAELALGLGIAAFAGLVATVPIGMAADRCGTKRMLILLSLLRAGAFAALAFSADLTAFTAFAAMQTAAGQASVPIIQALTGAVTAERDRVRTMAVIRSVRNIGFSVGALAAAPIVGSDSLALNRSLLVSVGVLIAIGGAIVLALRLEAAEIGPVKAKNPLAASKALADGPYAALAALHSVLMLHMTLLAVGVPLWISQYETIPAATVPGVIFLNTVLAVVLQVPLAKNVDDVASGVRTTRLAGAALAVTALVMAVGLDRLPLWVGVGVVAAACVTLTFGELWQAVGSWELSYALAPAESRTTHLSLFSLGRSVQEMIGPGAVAVVLAAGVWGWAALAVAFVAAAFASGPVARSVEERRRAPGPAEASATR
ncbi:MFS transporter [Glycomyces xiaoerkulensis]|uniref:MFS transporter n=1 Tax=Glycomyces xiaoerkulensis TaxID=2038139 RepID=UPI000C261284|nr:MFS transporter [Glycomyces xiaoerkulensis]